MFVIKPRSANRGKSVVIVHKDDLDETLKSILNSDQKLNDHSDRGYNYWGSDLSTTFLVEEFIATEPILVPELGNHLFDVTFRLAVVMMYQQETLSLHFLGSYSNLSDKPVNREGSLNEKYKTSLMMDHTIKTPRIIDIM